MSHSNAITTIYESVDRRCLRYVPDNVFEGQGRSTPTYRTLAVAGILESILLLEIGMQQSI